MHAYDSDVQKEVELMRTLRHPNVVSLIGVCREHAAAAAAAGTPTPAAGTSDKLNRTGSSSSPPAAALIIMELMGLGSLESFLKAHIGIHQQHIRTFAHHVACAMVRTRHSFC